MALQREESISQPMPELIKLWKNYVMTMTGPDPVHIPEIDSCTHSNHHDTLADVNAIRVTSTSGLPWIPLIDRMYTNMATSMPLCPACVNRGKIGNRVAELERRNNSIHRLLLYPKLVHRLSSCSTHKEDYFRTNKQQCSSWPPRI